MIHREPHRATPRRKMVCTLHTIMRQQRGARARVCTRDSVLAPMHDTRDTQGGCDRGETSCSDRWGERCYSSCS